MCYFNHISSVHYLKQVPSICHIDCRDIIAAMTTSQIIGYIRSEKAKNRSDETIRASLYDNGWKHNDIEEAMRISASDGAGAPDSADASRDKHGHNKKFMSYALPAIFCPCPVCLSFLTVGIIRRFRKNPARKNHA